MQRRRSGVLLRFIKSAHHLIITVAVPGTSCPVTVTLSSLPQAGAELCNYKQFQTFSGPLKITQVFVLTILALSMSIQLAAPPEPSLASA